MCIRADNKNTSVMYQENNRKRVRWWFLWVVPGVTGALVLVLIEVCLALFAPTPTALEQNMHFVNDPYTAYKLKPNSIGY